MDAKLDCEVDVEGAVGVVDMMVREEERQVGALARALIQPTAQPTSLEATERP